MAGRFVSRCVIVTCVVGWSNDPTELHVVEEEGRGQTKIEIISNGGYDNIFQDFPVRFS